jgi:uncharacterized protein
LEDKLVILRDLKQHLQSGLDNSVKDVVLFGSQSTGEAKNDSDYDVLIVLENDFGQRYKNKIYDLCYDIDLKYDIIIDAHMIAKSEINALRGRQPFFINALKTGIYI